MPDWIDERQVLHSTAALDFLASHQPMPKDEHLSDDVIRKFDAVRRHFIGHPDKRCLPLMLGALPPDGKSSGFGVYQLLDDLLRAHETEDVLAALDDALRSPAVSHASFLDLALDYADPRLLRHAQHFVDSSDADERELAEAYLDLHGNTP